MGYLSKITALAVLLTLISCQPDHKPFESKAWLNGDYRERGRMYGDLLKNHPLEGRTAADLKQLLGSPNSTDTTLAIMTWHMDLGWTALFHMDVHIDPATSRVDSVRVWD
jgi:hypothetical protein